MTTAIDTTTNTTTTIHPATIYTDGDYSAFALYDLATRKPIYWNQVKGWMLDTDEDATPEDGEEFTDIYGADEKEWEAAANTKLSTFNLRLGDHLGDDTYAIIED